MSPYYPFLYPIVLIPELGAVFFINSSNEQCLRQCTKEEINNLPNTTNDSTSSSLTGITNTMRTKNQISSSNANTVDNNNNKEIQERASAISWTTDCIPVKDLSQNIQWEIQQYLKEIREND